ncbi:MAG TPA: VWA domain-containing protein [Mucilaginibacter sp.]|nr:VWA domain-containing protein [Mucilaginibacter sp.]
MWNRLTQIGFSAPQWFILLLVIPVLIYVHYKYLRNRSSGMVINGGRLENGTGSIRLSPVDYLLVLRLLAVAIIVTGLTNPQVITKTSTKSPDSQTDIVFALDISKSMLIEDIKPNRLEALKDVLNRFIAMRSQDRMGIVLYAGESMNWCPLTKNYPLLLSRINKMEESDLGDGTAIGSGLSSAINILRESPLKSRVIILLTDGENNAGIIDPQMAAQFAKRLNIKIYVVGIGSTGFALMPLRGLDGQKYYQKIYVTLNEWELKKIAAISGGSYFRATDIKALQNIYAAINKLETKKIKYVTTLNYSPCFEWFIGIALLVLFAEVFLKFTLLRTWPA